MRPSQMVEPMPDIIREVKQSYNRVLKRCNEASKYLDNPEVPQIEKDKRMVIFKIEIVDVLEAYLQALQDWGVEVSPGEIINGFSM